MKVLVAAASRHGSTAEIAQALAEELRSQGFAVTVVPPDEVGELAGFDAVVLGSAVYAGHWLEPAVRLARRVGTELPRHPVWLFSSGPVGDPSRKIVQRMGADPIELPRVRRETGAREHRVFAGKLDRKALGGVQRAALWLFRDIEGDFRDWQAIRDWAASIADRLKAASAA